MRDFYVLLTVGLLAQKRQQFGLSGLGFLPTAITLDACDGLLAAEIQTHVLGWHSACVQVGQSFTVGYWW